MEKKTINLGDILKKELDLTPMASIDDVFVIGSGALEIMYDVCKKVLELAAENAECEDGAIIDYGDEVMSASVNKQSILNTINQVEL